MTYRKIAKISPGAYIFQRPFLRGFSTEGNLRFKIDWASLIVGRKFTVFALFYFALEGNFQVQALGGLYLEGRFNGGYFALRVWGAYTWRGLFSEFYGNPYKSHNPVPTTDTSLKRHLLGELIICANREIRLN